MPSRHRDRSSLRVGRREFLQWSSLAACGGWYPAIVTAAESAAWNGNRKGRVDDRRADCRRRAGRMCRRAGSDSAGASVVMTEPTDWIGGQITQQAVPTDDHRWIESCGCTRSYRELRERIRDYYRTHFPLTDEARARPHLNPGGPGPVSPLAHEPKVCLAVLQELLAPAVQAGKLRLLLNTRPVAADTAGDRVRAVRLVNMQENRQFSIRAKYFVDASETGELLPLTGTEFVTGSESQAQTERTACIDRVPTRQHAGHHLVLCASISWRTRTSRSTSRPSTTSGAGTVHNSHHLGPNIRTCPSGIPGPGRCSRWSCRSCRAWDAMPVSRRRR